MMNNNNVISQVGSMSERLNNEISVRSNIQDGISSLQSDIDQLKLAVTTSTSTNPFTTMSSAMSNTGFPAQPPGFLNPMACPSQQFTHSRFPSPLMQQFPFNQPIYQPNPLVDKINQLNDHLQQLKTQFEESNNIVSNLRDDMWYIKRELNDQKQYPQRNNLIVHGFDDVPIAPRKHTQDSAEKFTDYVVDKINSIFPGIEGKFTKKDIDDTHIYRTRTSVLNSPKQLVIIRFCSRLMRNKIFSMKSSLKGTGISITEHLTQYNLKLLKEAQKRLKDKNRAWTHYGKVLINLDGAGYIKSVRDFDELDHYLP